MMLYLIWWNYGLWRKQGPTTE